MTNPEVTQANIQQTICVRGWTTTIRPPASYTNTLKKQQLQAVRFTDKNAAHYDEDHFISLELGGTPRDVKKPVARYVGDTGHTADLPVTFSAVARQRLRCPCRRTISDGSRNFLDAQSTFVTQILSVITHEYALLVSDRRLTYAAGPHAGEVHSDDTCKLVSLCNTCGIGYSGLSRLGGHPTHEWIATTLADANCRDVNKASNVLIDTTPAALPAAAPELRRQIFVFAGWAQFDSPPGLRSHFCVVTNAIDESGGILAQPLPEFHRRVRALRDEELFLWHSIRAVGEERTNALDEISVV